MLPDDWFVLSMRIQVTLESLFYRLRPTRLQRAEGTV